jgi:MoaA/NifB/PqqE/SkfB family radical SAM enzyme
MYKLEDIRQVHLEVTQKCQAACPMCDRNQNGGDLNPHIDLSELTLEDCVKIFSPKFIQQLDSMYMCGNLGDAIVAEDTLEIFELFRYQNPNIHLSLNTNAGARDHVWWQSLAKVIGKNGHVIFSVDGLEDTNHLYRQNVQWAKVEQAMDSYISGGGRARWDFLIFEHNQHQVEQAEKIAKQKGFEKFVAKKTGRFVTTTSDAKQSHQAKNRKGEDTTELKKPDEQYQNAALKKQKSIVDKYGSMDAYYDAVPIRCKVAESKSIYVSAEGLVLPCCWTAGRMYKWWHKDPRVEQIWQHIDAVGGKSVLDGRQGLENVFDSGIFDSIQSSWNKSSCQNGKLKVCSMKCGVEWDPYTEQFK